MLLPQPRRTILVIDEDPSYFLAIARIASKQDHDAIQFRQRHEFVAWVSSHAVAEEVSCRSCCIVFDAEFVDVLQHELVFRQLEGCPRICLSRSSRPSVTLNSIKLGVFDFIEKPVRLARLTDAIERAFSYGDSLLSQYPRIENLQKRLQTLTKREIEVWRLLASGMSSKAISFQLNISPKTFYVHRSNLMAKTGAGSTHELNALLRTIAGGNKHLDVDWNNGQATAFPADDDSRLRSS